MAAFRYLTGSQIAEFVFDGSAVSPRCREIMTWRLLGVLRRRGLIGSTPRMVGGPGGGSARLPYHLTTAGYRFARSLSAAVPERRPKSPGTFLIRHGLMTAEVALAFRRAARLHPGHELIDWQRDWQAAMPLGGSVLVPDAYLEYDFPKHILAFLEVDMGGEGTPFFARKIRRYLDLYRSGGWRSRLPLWPLILVVTETDARATQLRDVTEAVCESQTRAYWLVRPPEFDFASVSDPIGPAGPLGEIWHVAGRAGRKTLTPPADAATTFCRRCGRIHQAPVLATLAVPQVDDATRDELSQSEVDAALVGARATRNPRRNELILRLALTGLRKREILGLRLRDVDVNTGTIFVRPEFAKYGRKRTMTLWPEVASTLDRYLIERRGLEDPDAALLLKDDGTPLT